MDKDRKELLERVRTFYRTTASGRKVRWDEPTETEKNEPLRVNKDKFRQDLDFWKKRNQQSAARDRLKKKGAVPTKSGRRLFDDFCREAYKGRKQNMFDGDMRNIYNASQHLSYEQWTWFMSEQYEK